MVETEEKFKHDEKKKYIDVDEKITRFLLEQLLRVKKDRLIDWKEFYDYCLAFGVCEAPNLLTVPEPVLERCIEEAKKRYYENSVIYHNNL